MSTEITSMASLQDKVKERIKASFLDLIPPEMWEGLVQAQLHEFTKVELPKLVKAEAEARLKVLLGAEFTKSEWQARWVGGSTGELASSMVTNILKEVAPELVSALFGGMAQRVVSDIRNNSGRY